MAFVVKDFPGIVIAEEAEWKDSIHGSNGVVNLAGMPISTRWSPEVSIKPIKIKPPSVIYSIVHQYILSISV